MGSLYGRAAQMADASRCLDAALDGRGGVLLLCGEPGIGKSRIATEVAELAGARGASVAWGRCWEVGGAPAFWPWIEALRALGLDLFEGLPAGGAGGGQDERFLVFQRVTSLLREAASRSPLVVVIDDLHAADAPSLHLALFLARSLRGSPILLVFTAREVESRATPEHIDIFGKLSREATVIALPRLERHDVEVWLGARVPGCADRAEDVFRITEGNPLFVEEVLRVGADGRTPLFHGLAAVMEEHLRRLSPAARAVLEIASVLGREVVLDRLARLAAVSLDDADAAIREGERAGVLVAHTARCSFAHVLLRDRLYDALAPSRRAELHWRAAEVLEDAGADAVTVAHHLLAGASAGDASRAVRSAIHAAEQATTRLGFEAAAALCEQILALPASTIDARARCDAELALADALSRAGDPPRSRAAADRATILARELGDGDALARAALLHSAEMVSAMVVRDMIDRLEEALAALPEAPSALRARVMSRLAAAHVPPVRVEDGRLADALAAEALEMSEAFDDDTRLYCLRFAASARGYQLDADERFAISEEAITLARARKQVLIFLQAAGWHASSLCELGRGAEADAIIAELGAVAEALPQPFHKWRWLASRSAIAGFRGDLETSKRLADEFADLAELGGNATGRVAWALQRCSLAFLRGDPASIAEDEERVLPILANVPPLRPYGAWVHAALGRFEAARIALGDVDHEMFALNFPWAIVAGDAAAMTSDAATCEPLYRHLSPERLRQRFFWGPAGSFAFGPTPLVLARLARVLGRIDDARAHFEHAVALCREAGTPPLLAIAERELATLGTGTPRVASSGRVPEEAARRGVTLQRDGEGWRIARDGGEPLRLRHGKGLEYLDALLARPGEDVFVLTLVGSEHGPSDAGVVLDETAKRAYRERLEELADELGEAERFDDGARASRAREQIDLLTAELAGAVGLGGRDRRAGSNVERARVNVQRRLRDAIARIREHDEDLGNYLEACVKTGTFCSFRPV